MTDLPDFEDMQGLISKIRQLSIQKNILEIEIKAMESKVFERAADADGKPMFAVSYIESRWKYAGFEGEIIPLRKQLAQAIAELEEAKLTFELLRDQIEVWRSEQANNRISLTSG